MKNKYSELLNEIIHSVNIESTDDMARFEQYELKHNIVRERYDVDNDYQAKILNKEKGRYEIFTITEPLFMLDNVKKYLVEQLSKVIKELMGEMNSNDKILVVGLGNRHISSDSLGIKVVSKINITFGVDNLPNVMAICPSVLGLTGIETYDIISGVVSKVKPTHMIVIDSLCAGDSSRLGKSIQLTNTGICPGSGIKNYRKCIDKKLCKNIVSIGVPLLIYASTFLTSTFNLNGVDLSVINDIMQISKKSCNKEKILKFITNIKKVYKSDLEEIIVTSKDIEEAVDVLSDIISLAINSAI